MPKVVIVMPAYRAARTLAKTVQAIPPGVADELLLVDDASPDGTAELARRMGLRVHVHPTNLGYGGNQKTCYTQALRDGADIVVLLHPDYQYDPEAVPLLVAPLLAGRADMTFGSRFAGLGDPMGGGMPLYRYLGNRITTTLENLMLGSRFTEMHSGMRAYTRDCLLSLPYLTYSNGFSFDSQFLVDAVTSGLRVVEVPIPTRYTKESSSIGIGRSIRYVAASLAYCAWRTAERGRRGRRSPVVLRRSTAPGVVSGMLSEAFARITIGEGDPNEGVTQGGLLPEAGASRGFFVRGARVVSTPANGSAGPGLADVVVIRTRDVNGSDPAEYLARVREAIDDEGLLIAELGTNGDGAGAGVGELLRALPEAGFAPIGWSRSGPEALVARPVSHRAGRR
jgi:hypothetical protein